jgi:hypothetical protein
MILKVRGDYLYYCQRGGFNRGVNGYMTTYEWFKLGGGVRVMREIIEAQQAALRG